MKNRGTASGLAVSRRWVLRAAVLTSERSCDAVVVVIGVSVGRTCSGLPVQERCNSRPPGSSRAAGHTDSDRSGRPRTRTRACTDTGPPWSTRSPHNGKTCRTPGTCRRRPDQLWGGGERTLVFRECVCAPVLPPGAAEECLILMRSSAAGLH